MTSLPSVSHVVAVAVVAAALCACDKRPPSSEREGESETAGTSPSEKTSEDDAESSESSGRIDDHRTDGWKANDAHTHLDPTSYPIVEKIFEKNDVYRAINLSGGHSKEYRAEHLERADELPGRIALFFNIDWDDVDDDDFGERMASKLERAVEQGFAGLKISKSLGLEVETEDGELLPVDSPKLDPLWEKAGELGVPVTIHTADPKAFFEKPGPENERWEELKEAPDWSFHGEEYPSRKSLLEARDRMVSRHSDTTFILAHMGNNPEDMDYVAELLEKHDNLYVDTSARIAEFGRHPADEIREFFIRFQDRILFGTDLGVNSKSTPDGLYFSLFLGSIRKDDPTLEDVGPFFDKHWRYFESDAEEIPHPIPIQGDWKVHPIDLPEHVLAKVYWKNAERLVFAPWLGRRAAQRTTERAAEAVAEGAE